MPSGEKLYDGGFRPKGKVTTSDTKWDERIGKESGKTSGYFVTNCIMPNGEVQELAIWFGLKEYYEGKAYIKDGKFLDVSDEPSEQYQFSRNSEIGQFFETAKKKGVPGKILSAVGNNPSGFDGITFTLEEVANGKKRKFTDRNGVNREVDDTWIQVESVESVASDKKKAATTPAAASKSKPAAATTDDTSDDDVDSSDNDIAELIGFAGAAVADPKGVGKLPTWSKSEHGGGVSVEALKRTSMTWIKPTKADGKPDRGRATSLWAKFNNNKNFWNEYAELGGWTPPNADGIVFATEE